MNWIDSGIMRALGRIADFIILNILWLICSIPIITIGASTTALYTLMLKIAKNEEGYIVRGFFKAFKENFKKSTILWLIIVIIAGVITVDWKAVNMLDARLQSAFRLVFIFVSLMLFCLNLYVFPLTARYENTIKQTIKNALILSVAKLPYTALMVIVTVGSVMITFLTPRLIVIGMVFWPVIGVSFVTWLNSCVLRRVFKVFEIKKER